jgi:hypothetical protein
MLERFDFETIRIQVVILSEYFPEYSGELNKMVQYAHDDPSAALLKSRQILENIGSKIWATFETSDSPSPVEIYNHHKIKEITPKRIMNRIHGLRTMSNLGIHKENVTPDDVTLCLNNLFAILDWYGVEFKKLAPLPEPVQPPHPFGKYLKNSVNDKAFLFAMLFNVFLALILFHYHRIFPAELSRPFRGVYEGIFLNGFGPINGLSISLVYSLIVVFISCALSWIIFRRFRKQNFESRILSFELMFTLVFSTQYFLLNLLDLFTRLF